MEVEGDRTGGGDRIFLSISPSKYSKHARRALIILYLLWSDHVSGVRNRSIDQSRRTAHMHSLSIFGSYFTFSVLVKCWVKSTSSQGLPNVCSIISQSLPNISVSPINSKQFTKEISSYPPLHNYYSMISQFHIGWKLAYHWEKIE